MYHDTGSITPRTVGPKESLPPCKKKIIVRHSKNLIAERKDTLLLSNQKKQLALIGSSYSLTLGNLVKTEIDTTISAKTEELKSIESLKGDMDRLKKLEATEKIIMSPQFYDLLVLDKLFFTIKYRESFDKTLATPTITPNVLRYGIEPDSIKCLAGMPLHLKSLHPIEKKLIGYARKKLSTLPAAEDYLAAPNSGSYPENVVLVDIFVRDNVTDDYVCKIEKKEGKPDVPEIHTVALWKIKANKYLLIDPTKSEHSSHLCQVMSEIITGDAISVDFCDYEGKYFYSHGAEPGKPKHSKPYDKIQYPRDCTDIAVKIGFELNELQMRYEDLELEKGIDGIVELMQQKLSNNATTIATYLPLQEHFICRQSQSSNFQKRQEAHSTLMLGFGPGAFSGKAAIAKKSGKP